MDHHELDKLIDRYLQGNCTPVEKQRIEEWLDMQHHSHLWDWSSVAEQERTKKYIQGKLRQSIARKQQQSYKKNSRFIKIAACIACLLAVGAFAARIPVVRDYLASFNHITLSAPKGHTLQAMLPDSSIVVLNVGSSIRYSKDFSDEIRKVELLDGEVWFDVKKDLRRPFVVLNQAIETRVLGTSFNIRSYHFLPQISITVASGKVQVRDVQATAKNDANIIIPNKQLKIDKQNRQQQLVSANLDQILAWKQDRLSFDEEPLDLVAFMLEQKFEISIRMDGIKSDSMLLTADFEPTDSLESILQAIAATFDLSYTKASNTIVLKKENNDR